MTFKIATWNVNSLRVRLPHVLQWLKEQQPDILALQETKLIDADFPEADLEEAGYKTCYSGQKTYNGVAVLSRSLCRDTEKDIPGLEDAQRRMLGVTIEDVRVLNLYVPNGESVISDKYGYKLNWLQYLQSYLIEELKKHPKLVVLGDFNIAPEPEDVHDPAEWQGKVLFSEKERMALKAIMDIGLVDSFRLHTQPEKSYSWWDYRMNAFKRNRGLRIDHIFISPLLASVCERCYIDKTPRGWERPSDHAPVVAEFRL